MLVRAVGRTRQAVRAAPAVHGEQHTQSREISGGPGGYSSVTGVTATVFGATGFLGRYVVGQLAGKGTVCKIPYRGDDHEVRHLKPMGDYGKVSMWPFHARDRDSIRAAVEGSDCVINLVGKHYETTHLMPWWVNNSFDDTHVQAALNIAEVSREMGVKQLIHVSALAASYGSQSNWAQTKARGEAVVRSAFPGATIVRPAVMFGDEDRFFNRFAIMARAMPRFPLPGELSGAARQPVYVNDVATAINKMVQNPDAVGHTFDLAGDEVSTVKECVEFVFRTIKRPPEVVDLPVPAVWGMAAVAENLPNPMYTRDQLALDLEDNTLAACGGADNRRFEDLGMHDIQAFRDVSIRFLHQYRMGGHFIETNV